MATDLNLHRKTAVNSEETQEGRARDYEVHNRERTWIMCFVLDRSFSAQLGKPYSIKEECVSAHVNLHEDDVVDWRLFSVVISCGT